MLGKMIVQIEVTKKKKIRKRKVEIRKLIESGSNIYSKEMKMKIKIMMIFKNMTEKMLMLEMTGSLFYQDRRTLRSQMTDKRTEKRTDKG